MSALLVILLLFFIFLGSLFMQFYECRSVLELPQEESRQIAIADSLVVSPVFYNDYSTNINASIEVDHLSDSIYFKDPVASIICEDNPSQRQIIGLHGGESPAFYRQLDIPFAKMNPHEQGRYKRPRG